VSVQKIPSCGSFSVELIAGVVVGGSGGGAESLNVVVVEGFGQQTCRSHRLKVGICARCGRLRL
jgi:hypothetical protein